MKKKHLFLIPALTLGFSSSAWAQDVHPALTTVASKIDTKAEYFTMNKLSGDLAAATQYLDLMIDTARKSGEPVPAGLKAKDIMGALGIDTIKAYGLSSTKVDNAWVNRSFLDNAGNHKGIFSIFGSKNQDFKVTSMAPAGTDLALQMQLDLRQIETIANAIANSVGEGEKTKKAMSKEIPEMDMTVSDLLSKINVTANVVMDLDANKTVPTPFGEVGRPLVTVRLDGLAWLWDKFGERAIFESEAPFKKSVEGDLTYYRIPAEVLKQEAGNQEAAIIDMFGISPVILIDKKSNHIWMSSNEEHLQKCRSSKNTLAETAEFKAAFDGLPNKGNSMAYVSKYLLKEISEKYTRIADSGMLGEEFGVAKPLVDRLMEDITESDKGWSMTLGLDDKGVAVTSRGPLASKHLNYLTSILPLLQAGSIHEEKFEMDAPRRRAQ